MSGVVKHAVEYKDMKLWRKMNGQKTSETYSGSGAGRNSSIYFCASVDFSCEAKSGCCARKSASCLIWRSRNSNYNATGSCYDRHRTHCLRWKCKHKQNVHALSTVKVQTQTKCARIVYGESANTNKMCILKLLNEKCIWKLVNRDTGLTIGGGGNLKRWNRISVHGYEKVKSEPKCASLKLQLRKYPAMHTNHMLCHCTPLQYNHNIWRSSYAEAKF